MVPRFAGMTRRRCGVQAAQRAVFLEPSDGGAVAGVADPAASQSGSFGDRAPSPEQVGASWCDAKEPHPTRRARSAVDAGPGGA